MEDPHVPTPNWAEVVIALLSGFGLFGTAFGGYLRSRLSSHGGSLAKRMAEQGAALEKKIAEQRAEFIQEIADLHNNVYREVAEESFKVGESLRAIREKTTQVELWVRDNLVRRDEFRDAVEQLGHNLVAMDSKLEASRQSIDGKLERLLDRNTRVDRNTD